MARFLDILPDETELISNAASIAIIVLVIWDFMMDDGKKAAVLHAISVECGDYYLRLDSLWVSLNQEEGADETDIRAELRAIEEGMLRATARAGYADIREHDRDNKRATTEAYQVVSDRFAADGGSHG